MTTAKTCAGRAYSGKPCKASVNLDEDGRCASHPLRRCRILSFGQPCGARVRAGEEACPKHAWALDEGEATKKANAVLAEMGRKGAAVESARRQLSELSGKIRLAEAELAAVEKDVARMLDKHKDAELLANAEGNGPEAQEAVVALVRERRMQRAEVAQTKPQETKPWGQFHRHVDADWDP